jgi:hypothetical protein
VEAQAQMKYHHSERCFTYRMKRPMVFSESAGSVPSRFGIIQAGDRFHERLRSSLVKGGARAAVILFHRGVASWGPNRGENCSNRVATSFCLHGRRRGSLVSRHLPDGEFGWGGISVTRQRRCPKASSVGTEISRRTQA